MATLAEFFPHLLPLVPGCPQMLAEMTLRQVAIEFCVHAPVVQEVLDPIDVVAGQTEYDIDTAFGSSVTMILQAQYQGLPMGRFRRGDSTYIDPLDAFAPYRYMQGADNIFMLDRAPGESAAGAIVMIVATRPAHGATTVSNILLHDYSYELASGAAARLMLMPGQLWSNPKLAGSYQAIYMQARTNARIRADASFGRATTRVQPRPFQ